MDWRGAMARTVLSERAGAGPTVSTEHGDGGGGAAGVDGDTDAEESRRALRDQRWVGHNTLYGGDISATLSEISGNIEGRCVDDMSKVQLFGQLLEGMPLEHRAATVLVYAGAVATGADKGSSALMVHMCGAVAGVLLAASRSHQERSLGDAAALVAFLSGPQGVGKSALVENALRALLSTRHLSFGGGGKSVMKPVMQELEDVFQHGEEPEEHDAGLLQSVFTFIYHEFRELYNTARSVHAALVAALDEIVVLEEPQVLHMQTARTLSKDILQRKGGVQDGRKPRTLLLIISNPSLGYVEGTLTDRMAESLWIKEDRRTAWARTNRRERVQFADGALATWTADGWWYDAFLEYAREASIRAKAPLPSVGELLLSVLHSTAAEATSVRVLEPAARAREG